MSEAHIASTQSSSSSEFVPYTGLGKVEHELERHLLHGAPLQLSPGQRARAVAHLPWVALVGAPLWLLNVALGLLVIGLSTSLGRPTGVLSLALTLAAAALDFSSLPGLFRRSRQGWARFVYTCLLCGAGAVVALDLFGIAASAVVLWLAFQLKYEYR